MNIEINMSECIIILESLNAKRVAIGREITECLNTDFSQFSPEYRDIVNRVIDGDKERIAFIDNLCYKLKEAE
nr:MAG TPA: hypothetical protein [Inoviridae sp.]